MKLSDLLLLTLLAVAVVIPGCKSTSDIVTPPPGPVWVTVTKANTSSLLDNKINCLKADQSGRVWIGTDSGANYYLRGSWGRIRDSLRYSPDGVQSRYQVNTIETGMGATIWFGLDGGGVRRYREGATRGVWTAYTVPTISYYNVATISADKVVNGDVWVGTPVNGVSRFIPSSTDPEFGRWEQFGAPPLLSGQVNASAINIIDNTVWFGTPVGLASYDDGISSWSTYPLSGDYGYKINSMTFDRGQTLWMAMIEGAASYNKGAAVWKRYTNATTSGRLPAGEVHAVTTDLGTVRWFGTDHGLIRLSDTTWTTFTTANTPELPNNVVTALTYDNKGNLWIGTKGGIAIFNPDGTVL